MMQWTAFVLQMIAAADHALWTKDKAPTAALPGRSVQAPEKKRLWEGVVGNWTQMGRIQRCEWTFVCRMPGHERQHGVLGF